MTFPQGSRCAPTLGWH